MAAQLIAVLRHAHAGDPSAWPSSDDLRPLSEKGCRQADQLVEHLGLRPLTILSSPSLRCVGTVLPLARACALPVLTVPELYEGGSAAAALRRLTDEAAPVVLGCTHGDVIAELLHLLTGAGVPLPELRAEKASTWIIELDDGSIRGARYLAPP